MYGILYIKARMLNIEVTEITGSGLIDRQILTYKGPHFLTIFVVQAQ
jgi:hypothetical protein